MLDEQFWRNAPKTYCDNANIAVASGSGDTFLLGLLSGSAAHVYAFTPEHMKRFQQLVAYHLESYEKAHGPITVEAWDPDAKSPIQIKDLKKGE